MFTAKPSERVAVMDVADPALVDNAAKTTGWIKLDKAQRVLGILLLGATDIGVTAIKAQEAKDGAGVGAQDLTGKSATDLTATDDNKQVLINVDAADLSPTYTHVRFTATVGDGVAGAQIAWILLGLDLRYQKASDFNDTSVAQIVG